MQFTEGVVAREERAPTERALRAGVVRRRSAVELAVGLSGGRAGEGGSSCKPTTSREASNSMPTASRCGSRSTGIAGPRSVWWGSACATTRARSGGRDVQLGADRRYTGPDCPPELLAEGGIPQGDCAPLPWLLSSRGYAVWCQTDANGTRFDLAGERISVSTRAHAGPLRLSLFCARTPAARLRAFCRLTGFPALLPEWGYGFWKSRDVHEHQDDVLDDHQGFRRYRIPLDAIVIDSPWATQYNTWEFNPHQFPDARGMISAAGGGVRTVVWATPWVNVDSRDGQIPPQPESERLYRRPAQLRAGGRRRPLRHRAAARRSCPVVDGDRLAGRLHQPRPRSAWWRESAKRVLELGVEGIKADDGEGYYIPDHVRLADGRTGAQAAWALAA